jgi:hypothetical protein
LLLVIASAASSSLTPPTVSTRHDRHRSHHHPAPQPRARRLQEARSHPRLPTHNRTDILFHPHLPTTSLPPSRCSAGVSRPNIRSNLHVWLGRTSVSMRVKRRRLPLSSRFTPADCATHATHYLPSSLTPPTSAHHSLHPHLRPNAPQPDPASQAVLLAASTGASHQQRFSFFSFFTTEVSRSHTLSASAGPDLHEMGRARVRRHCSLPRRSRDPLMRMFLLLLTRP